MAQKGIALRKWSIKAEDYGTDAEFRQAVVNELASFEHIGERLGIGLVAVPVRTRLLPDGDYRTAAWVFQTATVPSTRDDEPAENVEMPDLAGVGTSE